MGETAVVLVSGGVDSAVCLSKAVQEHERIEAVYCSYGQWNDNFTRRMASGQVMFWDDVVEFGWHILDYGGALDKYGEGITGDNEMENEDGSVTREDGRGLQYVPMRNLHFLAGAGAVADTTNTDAIYFGAQAWNEDVAPDARVPFAVAAEAALSESLPEGDDIEVKTPLIDKTKTETVELGEYLNTPWEKTWSCYEKPADFSNPVPCGICHSCKERAQAFAEAGIEDPHGTLELVPEEERGVRT